MTVRDEADDCGAEMILARWSGGGFFGFSTLGGLSAGGVLMLIGSVLESSDGETMNHAQG